ncbi:MAG: class I SAM-dependent methyltransferase [Gemmatimonadetes bacterium]|nr:class I SAM-dependent methyltransferase [Gemmatimonadota bacterium]
MNPMHEKNRQKWQVTASRWKARRDVAARWRTCAEDPLFGFEDRQKYLLRKHIGNLRGKRVCVLGSGDNYAAFGLAQQGAEVTSVDISEAQLQVAAERADILGLNIRFVQGDISDLPSEIKTRVYDFSCSVGVVAIWLSNLKAYYGEAHRILKPGGFFMIGETHPIRQVLHHCEYFHDEKDAEDKIRMEYHYFDHTPKEYLYNPETGKGYALVSDVSLEERKGKPTQFNFHWTVSDFVMALIETEFALVDFFEKPAAHPENWRENMLDGLPQGLRILARKR